MEKLCRQDSASAEELFSLIKQEFFYSADREDVGDGEVMNELDTWVQRFRSNRISQALGYAVYG